MPPFLKVFDLKRDLSYQKVHLLVMECASKHDHIYCKTLLRLLAVPCSGMNKRPTQEPLNTE